VFVKNITVTIEDNLYRKARLQAAERNSSLTAVVREFLKGFCQQETDFERRLRQEKETLAALSGRSGKFSASARLGRDEIHQRRAVS
jgi:hypothetical protein